MSTLRHAVQDYIEMRRGLGFKLRETERGLIDFVTFLFNLAMHQRNIRLEHFAISKLIREMVEARITSVTVEIFHKGQRIASHAFSADRNRHTTITEHMPSAHRRYAEWTPAKMMSEAASIGPAAIALVEAIMKAKPHPEQGFRSCLGIISLVRTYGSERVEAASRRGNDIGATTYGSIKSILQNGLDKAYANSKAPDGPPIRHANIRGRGYYH